MSNRQKAKRKNFAHSSIVKYWCDYIVEHGELPWGSFIDRGEPNCFACGLFFPTNGVECKYWSMDQECKHADSAVHWNEWKLERCHVVPLFLGGADEICNIVLMCSTCHDAHPDSQNPQDTYLWMRTRPSARVGQMRAVAEQVLALEGLTDQQRHDKVGHLLGWKR